jgi:quercetin dioxygenase-like cupin family protein
MAISHAASGEIVDVRPLGAAISTTITHTIVKTDDLEVIRIVLLAGNELPPHEVPGDISVQCLEGKVKFSVGNVDRELTAGEFFYVEGGGKHSLHAKNDSSLLVTIVLKHKT